MKGFFEGQVEITEDELDEELEEILIPLGW